MTHHNLAAITAEIQARETQRRATFEPLAEEAERRNSPQALERLDTTRADLNEARAHDLCTLLEATHHMLEAVRVTGEAFGNTYTAGDVASTFTCTEADALACTLASGGQRDAALTWLEGHALGDDCGDLHTDDHGRPIDLATHLETLDPTTLN